VQADLVEPELSLPSRVREQLAAYARSSGRAESEIMAAAVSWYLKQVDRQPVGK
jgi:hypothetical protein